MPASVRERSRLIPGQVSHRRPAHSRMYAPSDKLRATIVVLDAATIPCIVLTSAHHSRGRHFHCSDGPAGNPPTEVTLGGSVSYGYDLAHRLTNVGGVTYTWSDIGNLLSDGVTTYTYDRANRLATASEGGTAYAFTYNGLGDRPRHRAASRRSSGRP